MSRDGRIESSKDEVLIEELGAVIARMDPVPPDVLAAARAAIETSESDADGKGLEPRRPSRST